MLSKLIKSIRASDSLVCLGLDVSGNDIHRACNLIGQTKDLVCAYKLNLGFYLSDLKVLKAVLSNIPEDKPVILDGKFGDIQNTVRQYAKFCFENLKVDAVTVNPYMGLEEVSDPFLDYPDKMVFALSHTSNRPEIQEICMANGEGLPELVTRQARDLDGVGLVVGSNHDVIRQLAPQSWFLVPGIGAQEYDLESTVKDSLAYDKSRAIFNIGRDIIMAENPRLRAMYYRDEINKFRTS